jgi:pimeloyl-ACP methyl ester carboxylesterase
MPEIALRSGNHLYYEVTDLTDPWTDPATVFLHHGLGKSARWWLPWVRLLARDYRVLTIDMLGCGRSSQPEGYAWSVSDHAENAVQVLDALGLNRVHFMGETVGGCVGMVLGARHGDRVESLALAACPFRPAQEWLLEQSAEIARTGLQPTVDRDLPSRLDWSLYPTRMYEWYRQQRLDASARIVSEQYAAQADEDLSAFLPVIEAPTLLFIPDESPVNAGAQMHEMARLIPNASIAALADRRRPVWYHYAEADECVAAYETFLSALPAPAASS